MGEVGGALKNGYALAAGAIEGMGLGTNSAAFLVTRGCAEMNALSVAMGARAHTMAGLAGIGDLMLTCLGGASRNKAVGSRIGAGETLKDILQARQNTLEGVSEGVATTPAAVRLAKKYNVQMPLVEAVNAVLQGDKNPREAILTMMQMPRRSDFSSIAPRAETEKLLGMQREDGSVPGILHLTAAAAAGALLTFVVMRFSK